GFVSVVDVCAVRMRNCENLPNPRWVSARRWPAGVVCGVTIRVSNSINIPVAIIMEPSALPPEIGVAMEELLRCGPKEYIWTRLRLAITQPIYMQFCVIERANGTVATVFVVSRVEVRIR